MAFFRPLPSGILSKLYPLYLVFMAMKLILWFFILPAADSEKSVGLLACAKTAHGGFPLCRLFFVYFMRL